MSMSSPFEAWDYMLSRLGNTRSYRGFFDERSQPKEKPHAYPFLQHGGGDDTSSC